MVPPPQHYEEERSLEIFSGAGQNHLQVEDFSQDEPLPNV
jgi:hypothetical protein